MDQGKQKGLLGGGRSELDAEGQGREREGAILAGRQNCLIKARRPG